MKLSVSWWSLILKRLLPAGVIILFFVTFCYTLRPIDIVQAAQFQRPTDNHLPAKTSRLHYLIPASEPSLNLCANIISVLANRYPIPSILGYKGKNEFDAKVAHIAKLHSIRRYLNGPAGKHSDDLAIIADGHDVLAQLPAEVLIERYFEIMKRHDRVLADQFGLSVAQAHE
ncbi:hypothetical protein FVEN_g12906 [Fusarium venenatum]|uniref:Uncharacterized protein n=1 Tax=Fusarium venenatum TaxID=56646 RepID=A0A2L2TUP4_9HYPO|nr:uncharacterized protein FVRRES_08003 [Fusarium venenatum]KAG8354464.1 hypothetical protein FVEN_g12906 [Fusarium venenatum]CEI67926.1 unnamed protein product [Fusarium venenatum]